MGSYGMKKYKLKSINPEMWVKIEGIIPIYDKYKPKLEIRLVKLDYSEVASSYKILGYKVAFFQDCLYLFNKKFLE